MMHSSKLAWGLAALSSLAICACGDDGSTSTGAGGDGGGTSTGTGSPAATGSTSNGPGPGSGGSGPGSGGEGPGSGGSGPGSGGEGPGSGGGSGSGGAAPECGDGVINGTDECEVEELGGETCEGLGFWFGSLACGDDCTFDTRGCAGPEVCGDGRDNDLDGAPDCADVACAGDPSCDTGDEVCGNLDDDDDDGAFDCADSDCAGQAVCTPGDGPTGSACTTPADCASDAGDDPLCIPAGVLGSLDGYCSEHCDAEAQDCAAGSVCLDVGAPVCFASCTDSGDCRPGQDCVETGDPDLGSACLPGPAPTEDCDNDVDDDGDGDVDCVDLGCLGSPSCSDSEVQCFDLVDDDADLAIDCADPTICGSLFICEPGDRPTGSPCRLPSDCQAPNGAPACLTPAAGSNLPASGYCSGICEDDDDCTDGSRCLDGLCLAGCDSLYGCRPGQICIPEEDVCFPLNIELCGNGYDDDGDDLVDCDDPYCDEALACSTPETDCTNEEDDDADLFIDCADITDCGGVSADCVPGDGAAGEPCESNTDCDANADDPHCFVEANSGFSGGYCAEWCDVSAQDCGAGATCVLVTEVSGVCLATCDDVDDCRDGYGCTALDGVTVCLPAGG